MGKRKLWRSLTAFLLVALMIFGAAGCSSRTTGDNSGKKETADKSNGDQTKEEGTSSGGTVETANASFVGDPSEEYYMVTFLSGYSYWKTCYKGFEDAAKQFGVTPVYGGTTEYDVNEAVTAFEQICAKKPAGIAVSCMDADAYAPVIDKAVADGVNIVTFDSDSPNSDRITFLGTENYAAGAAAANYIGDKLGGSGKVAAVTTTGQSNINERIKGFSETLAANYPNIKLVQVVDSGSDEVTCASNVAGLLTNNPDLKYVFCALLLASTGTQQALTEANLTGKIKVVAFDTDDATLDAIKNGAVEATVSQAPYAQGYWSMVYLYFIKHGLINPVDGWMEKGYPSLPKTADSGASIVTKETCDNYYISK
ncbi:substrate-binding domain-containing protein [Anaerocolumna jejuensis]|uniref:substrate-binding domain-containing protein n=1 Tax=Anaerocolumna jejuensis TaxID=259063 RepID=UPI003F7BC685